MNSITSTDPKAIGQAGRKKCASVEELMAFFDAPFVEAAFATLLARPADPTGLRYYTQRLRLGHSRVSVLDQLAKSAEFSNDWSRVRGLKEAIDEYRASRQLSAWRKALFDPELGRTPAVRRARAIQNRIGGERQVIEQGIDQLRIRHVKLEQMIDELSLAGPADHDSTGIGFGEWSRFNVRARRVDEVRQQDLPSSSRSVLSKIRL